MEVLLMVNPERELLLNLNINWDIQSKEFIQIANYLINGIEMPRELIFEIANTMKKETKERNICMTCGKSFSEFNIANICPTCKNKNESS
jgi:rubrerythrin